MTAQPPFWTQHRPPTGGKGSAEKPGRAPKKAKAQRPAQVAMEKMKERRRAVVQPVRTQEPVYRAGIEYLQMERAYGLSLLAHVVLPVGLVVASLALMFLGLIDFSTPKADVPRDLEFVLTPPDHPEKLPVNLKTHYRSLKNMRAGGYSRPDKAVNLSKQNRTVSELVTMSTDQVFQPKEEEKQSAKAEESKPAVVNQAASESPKSSASASQAAGVAGSQANAAPGPEATPGVDALREPDFGPYMKDLQSRIRQTWHPPRGNESKKVVVVFRIHRTGELKDVKVVRSSGEPVADEAAILAVRQTFPFRPLPEDYRQENVDIEFTFDYNVFGDGSRSQMKS